MPTLDELLDDFEIAVRARVAHPDVGKTVADLGRTRRAVTAHFAAANARADRERESCEQLNHVLTSVKAGRDREVMDRNREIDSLKEQLDTARRQERAANDRANKFEAETAITREALQALVDVASKAMSDLECANKLHPEEIATDPAAQERPKRLREVRDRARNVLLAADNGQAMLDRVAKSERERDEWMTEAKALREKCESVMNLKHTITDLKHRLKAGTVVLAELSELRKSCTCATVGNAGGEHLCWMRDPKCVASYAEEVQRPQPQREPSQQVTPEPRCRWCHQSESNHVDGIGFARDCKFEPEEK